MKGATASMPIGSCSMPSVDVLDRQELVAGGVGQQDLDLARAVRQRDARLAGAVEVGGHDVAAAGRAAEVSFEPA